MIPARAAPARALKDLRESSEALVATEVYFSNAERTMPSFASSSLPLETISLASIILWHVSVAATAVSALASHAAASPHASSKVRSRERACTIYCCRTSSFATASSSPEALLPLASLPPRASSLAAADDSDVPRRDDGMPRDARTDRPALRMLLKSPDATLPLPRCDVVGSAPSESAPRELILLLPLPLRTS